MEEVVGLYCQKCKDIIVSWYRHDWKQCRCKAVFIDGGREYTRIGGNKEDWVMVKITPVEE